MGSIPSGGELWRSWLNKVENSSESGGGKALPTSPAIELERSNQKQLGERERARERERERENENVDVGGGVLCYAMLCSASLQIVANRNRTRGFCVSGINVLNWLYYTVLFVRGRLLLSLQFDYSLSRLYYHFPCCIFICVSLKI